MGTAVDHGSVGPKVNKEKKKKKTQNIFFSHRKASGSKFPHLDAVVKNSIVKTEFA